MNIKALEILLLVVGVALLAVYASARAVGEFERREAVAAFSAPDQSDWAAGRIAAYRDARAAPGRPLAVLRVDDLDLEVPVYGDTGERNLNRGAGHIEGTAAPGSDGNVGIAAHRDGYFRALQDVALGDTIELDSGSGVRRYRVTDLSVVEPTDVSSLRPTPQPALTLVTCYPFYFVGNAPQRYIVRAVAVN